MELKEKKFIAEKDYYELLGLDPSATIQEVENAYEKISNKILLDHPLKEERIKAAEKMLLINTAYETLISPTKRAQYDLAHKLKRRLDNPRVDDLFAEGLKNFRAKKINEAIHYFKQAVNYHPHKALYRVHLALAYYEKGWHNLAKNELQLALKIEPNNEFAQEVIAKLMFKLPDKKVLIFTNTFYKQVAVILVIFGILSALFLTDLPQKTIHFIDTSLNQNFKQASTEDIHSKNTDVSKEVIEELKAMNTPKPQNFNNISITKLPDDFIPKGQVYDYTSQIAVKKTYYPEQGIVVVNYKDGSVLTYKPTELIGWKIDPKTKQTVVITKENEIIPSPKELPLLKPNGEEFNEGEYPSNLFPEYQKIPSNAPTPPPPPSNSPEFIPNQPPVVGN